MYLKKTTAVTISDCMQKMCKYIFLGNRFYIMLVIEMTKSVDTRDKQPMIWKKPLLSGIINSIGLE